MAHEPAPSVALTVSDLPGFVILLPAREVYVSSNVGALLLEHPWARKLKRMAVRAKMRREGDDHGR